MGAKAKYKTKGACEKDKLEQKFIGQQMKVTGDACCFEDISHMGQEKAKCALRDADCDIPLALELALAGWSCKDLSKLRKMLAGESRSLRDGVGTSARTL
jgi:hypothetical protein